MLLAAVLAVAAALDHRVPLVMGLLAGTAAMVASLLSWDRSADGLAAGAWVCFALSLALSVAARGDDGTTAGEIEEGNDG